jgi:phospholipid/cholesterol/gamma-HCH transport system permease protein
MFIGFTQVNYAYFFLKSAGASDYTGLFTGLTTPRAAVLIMFGYVFAAKVGGGLAAEVGSMRISEEIDALEAEAINPMSYLIGTRILGAALFAPMAAVVALLACTLGSYLQAVPALQGLSSDTFLHYHWAVQNLTDQLLCIFNLMLQGMVIVLVSCYYGYKASGGPTAVGAAVARSLLVNIVAIHVLVAAHIMIFYGLTPTLPIGG